MHSSNECESIYLQLPHLTTSVIYSQTAETEIFTTKYKLILYVLKTAPLPQRHWLRQWTVQQVTKKCSDYWTKQRKPVHNRHCIVSVCTSVTSWHSTASASDTPSAKSALEESRCDHVVRSWRWQTGRDAAATAQSRGVTLGTAAERVLERDQEHLDEGSKETVHSESTPSHVP